jgi:hypothetical protein
MINSIRTCLCILTLYVLSLLPLHSQPFGIHRLTLPKWCLLSETDKAVHKIIRWLLGERSHSKEEGVTESLTVIRLLA